MIVIVIGMILAYLRVNAKFGEREWLEYKTVIIITCTIMGWLFFIPSTYYYIKYKQWKTGINFLKF